MSDKYMQHGYEDLESPAPAGPKDVVDAPGEKRFSEPGQSDRKHDNKGKDSGDQEQIAPSVKESGKME